MFNMDTYLEMCSHAGDDLRPEEQRSVREFLKTSGVKKVMKRLLIEKEGQQKQLLAADPATLAGQHKTSRTQGHIIGLTSFFNLIEEAVNEEIVDDRDTNTPAAV